MSRFLGLLLLSILFVACGGPSGTEVESSEAVDTPDEAVTSAEGSAWTVDGASSMVTWEGTKLVGGGHTGTIPVSSGDMILAGDKIVGGRFTLDVAQLENTDLDAEGAAKLVGHLKSADFFDVEKYPVATFDIVSVSPLENGENGATHEITGNLALHGQSRAISLPATVSVSDNELKATTPKFVIDRKEWGMEYGSGSIAGIAQDNIINDNVGLQLTLVARK